MFTVTSRQLLGSRSFRNYQQNLCRPNFRSYTRNGFTRPCRILEISARTRVAEGKKLSFVWKAAGVAGLGISLSTFSKPVVQCDSPAQSSPPLPPPPPSSVNLYELSFGTVCGVCAGVFIVKGAKMVAFVLGGVFVLLQYLGSTSLVRVDWGRVGSRFENLFYITDAATGVKRAPTVYSLWSWLVNFLTADFQPRASFLVGLALGLRVG
jgi:FUN14 domain-containing protein 1